MISGKKCRHLNKDGVDIPKAGFGILGFPTLTPTWFCDTTVFSVSSDGELGECEISTISIASTDNLNPYLHSILPYQESLSFCSILDTSEQSDECLPLLV